MKKESYKNKCNNNEACHKFFDHVASLFYINLTGNNKNKFNKLLKYVNKNRNIQ